MADNSSQLILDALGRAALHPEGAPLHGVTDLQRLMTSNAIDAPMRATVVRDGDLKSVVVTPAELRG